MKFLFVLDQLPYPPRNGITIPTFNWIVEISKIGHEASLLFLYDELKGYDIALLKANTTLFKNIWTINKKRQNLLKRILSEISNTNAFSLGWQIELSSFLSDIKKENFDIIWASPLSVHEAVLPLQSLWTKALYIMGLSDCNTAILRSNRNFIFLKYSDLKTRLIATINFVRSFRFGKIERSLLKFYDLILVQSDYDYNFIKYISNGKYNHKTLIVPNGFNKELLNIPLNIKGNRILFCGNLEGFYGNILLQFIKNQWSLVTKRCPDAELHVMGKRCPLELKNVISSHSNIYHTEFLDNIIDLYQDKAILIAPSLKPYGFINKTAEAMAAGIVIIGDYGTFNGIRGFTHRIHGIAIKNFNQISYEIEYLINHFPKRMEIAENARALIRQHLSWKEGVNKILIKSSERIKMKPSF